MEPIECLLIYDALLLLWMVAWGIGNRWKLDATLYISFFLFVCGVISTVYYPFADGILHDYSGITLMPFIYLLFCFILTSFPIMAYDTNGCTHIAQTDRQQKFLDYFCYFLILVSVEPFLENLVIMPSMIGNEEAIDAMYDARVYTSYIEPLSNIGRKLYRITMTFQFVYPVLLFFYLSRTKINWYIVIGIIMMISSMWIHGLITAGRTWIVQDIFYLVVTYFVMRRFLNKKIDKRILLYGSFFLGLGVIAVALVSLARFNSNDYMEDQSIWLWLGLYAGEGNLNFNEMMWNVIKDTGGDSSLILLKDILGLTQDTSVAANWDAVEKLGIPGNIFYTYVGAIYADFHEIGTVVFLAIISIVTYMFTKNQGKNISLVKVLLICLLARILVIPTFYTYATHYNQVCLAATFVFCLAYSLCGRLYFGRRQVF